MADILAQGDFTLTAPDLGVSLRLSMPVGLQALMTKLLAGWTFQPEDQLANPDIVITGQDTFSLSSPHYATDKSWSDIVSVLNEFAVALAYAVRANLPGSQMIHSAAYAENGRATLLFGARKAGKSVYTSRKAAAGARIFADDLLMWMPEKRHFRTLGITPRLRRPVPPDIIEALGPDRLITGHYTCYLNSDQIDLAPAGTVLEPDRYALLTADHELKTIRFYKVLKEITAHRIP